MEKEFKVGQTVKKVKGYKFDGIVVAVFTNLSEETRLVVEVEKRKPYGWCGCPKQHPCPIDKICSECGEIIELVEFENNCAGMLHIFSPEQMEIIC